MESYATALLYATPFFIGLVLVEILYGRFVKDQKHNLMDTVSSLSSGLTNVVKDSLGGRLYCFGFCRLLEPQVKPSYQLFLEPACDTSQQ